MMGCMVYCYTSVTIFRSSAQVCPINATMPKRAHSADSHRAGGFASSSSADSHRAVDISPDTVQTAKELRTYTKAWSMSHDGPFGGKWEMTKIVLDCQNRTVREIWQQTRKGYKGTGKGNNGKEDKKGEMDKNDKKDRKGALSPKVDPKVRKR